MTAERSAWIALAAVPGIGPATHARLVAAYGSAAAVLAAAPADPGRLAGIVGRLTATAIAPGLHAAASDPGAPSRAVESRGGWALTPLDRDYPATLFAIGDPPPVLYGVGDPASLAAAGVAIVGTRRPTARARWLAARIGRAAVLHGATVVSGLALGVDAEAHRAAIDAGGRTNAFIGGGFPDGWPRGNGPLAASMLAAGGAIAGELAPGLPATVGTFPRRNRLIAAVARLTVIVEAPEGSGALITARHALEQGHPVLVAVEPAAGPQGRGGAALLAGSPALPLGDPDELGRWIGPVPGTARTERTRAPAVPLGPAERALATVLREGPAGVDRLVGVTRRPAGEVAAALILLQARGLARPVGPLWVAAGSLLEAGDRPDGPVGHALSSRRDP